MKVNHTLNHVYNTQSQEICAQKIDYTFVW